MSTSTVTSKGQVTIPRDVRKALNLKARDKVIFVLERDRAILIPARRKSMMELLGCLPATKPYPGTNEIREEVRRRRGQQMLEVCE
jgi:AbrB family looped-hinge helix DNA binding protein